MLSDTLTQKNLTTPNILWEPNEAFISQANLTRFAEQVGFPLLPYERLHRWSIAYPEKFWSAVWDFADVIGEKGEEIIKRPTNGDMLGTRWFPEAQLNFAENLLRGDAEKVAVIEAGEMGVLRILPMGELCHMVARAQEGLRTLGVKCGDRVAGVVTNCVEGLVALLATVSLGAVWTSCSPDFGVQGIVDRIGQVQPKVLIASLDYRYNGKMFDISDKISAVCERIDGISSLVTLTGSPSLSIGKIQNVLNWQELCQNESSLPKFTRVPFDHPLYILYTSGTTGLPKAIVHSAGGTLVQHLKEHQLHCDVKTGDVMSWYTNTAWMMYHWLISGLASGAAILLYDGSAVPKGDGGVLWRIASEIGVTHFGTSPKYIDTMMKMDYSVAQKHDLSHLRSILSAGAPVSAEQFDWLYDHVKKDMMFASISGGADIIGCFVMGSPVHPVRRGEITCKSLGMAVDVLDDRGASVLHRKGDLVCTEPFPSMPITFWGEDGEERYRASYFSDRSEIWTHGDLAEQTIDGTVVIYGRTDTTLKPSGVRIGTAEIYRVVEHIPQVQDSLVFGLPTRHDEEIVLCVVIEGSALDQALADDIRKQIRTQASPRHVPRRIYRVHEVPYTLNGKKVETAVRAMVLGQPVKNKGSIINPECLQEYARLLERGFK